MGSLIAARIDPVSRFLTVTFTPGNTAPDESAAVPEIAPDTCARAAEVHKRVNAIAEQKMPSQLVYAFIPFCEGFMDV
jgi:hypothetical protein